MKTSDIVFFGTPPFAVTVLRAILDSKRQVPLVVSQPDRDAGRGRISTPPAMSRFCHERKLALIQPKKMKDPEFHDALRGAKASLFVVAAFGRILPRTILELPELCLNVHASLLPRWRGAAPIERAILAGDTVTGVSIMRLVEELDAGDVMLMESTEIGPEETGGTLTERLAEVGASALLKSLDLLEAGQARFEPQDPSHATFAPPIHSEEARIDWMKQAREIHNLVRAFHPRLGTYAMEGEKRLKIHRVSPAEPQSGKGPGAVKVENGRLFVACADRWLEILELQREGRGIQPAATFVHGYGSRQPTSWS